MKSVRALPALLGWLLLLVSCGGETMNGPAEEASDASICTEVDALMRSGTMNAVDGANGFALAVGNRGVLMRRSPSGWEHGFQPWATSEDDLLDISMRDDGWAFVTWVSSDGSGVLAYDGNVFHGVRSASLSDPFEHLAAAPDGSIWVTRGDRVIWYSGEDGVEGWQDVTRWTAEQFAEGGLNDVDALSKDAAIVLGKNGDVHRFSGGSWSTFSAQSEPLSAVIRSVDDIVVGCRNGLLLHFDGSDWSQIDSGTTQDIIDLEENSGQLFSLDSQGVIRQLSGVWAQVADAGAYGPADLWVESASEFHTASPDHFGRVARFTGNQWHLDGMGWFGAAPTAGVCHDDGSLTIVGGQVSHYRNGIWSTLARPSYALYDVFEATSVFAVGGRGFIMRGQGTSWTEMNSNTTAALNAVWATSDTDVFAVGAEGTIVHFDGSEWATHPSGTTATLTDVWGSASDDVYAVGAEGTLLHYDGQDWSPEPLNNTNEYLSGIDGSGPNHIVVGGAGMGLVFDGSSWSRIGFFDEHNLDAAIFSHVIVHDDGVVLMMDSRCGWLYAYDGSKWRGSGQPVTWDSVWGICQMPNQQLATFGANAILTVAYEFGRCD